MVASYGGQILNGVLSNKSTATQALAQQVYGLGAQYGVMLPYSRKNESEADHLGLVFAAMAGYNPEAAIVFGNVWLQREHKNTGVYEYSPFGCVPYQQYKEINTRGNEILPTGTNATAGTVAKADFWKIFR